jgi:hypothetical protein
MSDSPGPRMAPASLIVHCLYEKIGDQWQAFSLEFGLAAQADTYPEAQGKLDEMVRSYVFDALVGEDREHASELLARRATAEVYLKYYMTLSANLLRRLFGGESRSIRGTYERPLPMTPTGCAA